jgi:GAF domain-containing protein
VSSFHDSVDRGMAALSEFFVDDGTLGDTLLRVAGLACEVSGADMGGITLLVEGKPRTGVFTDPEAPDIDEAQYSSGNGPCLDAFRTQRMYRIESVAEDDRWPEFSKMACDHGIVTTLSLPLHAHDESLGAMNLYARTPGVFDDQCVERALGFAKQASIVLANAQVYWDARQLNENLQQAMKSRATIDQAVGVLLSRGGHTPEDAFQVLVKASQRENRKLREIAESIVKSAVEGNESTL